MKQTFLTISCSALLALPLPLLADTVQVLEGGQYQYSDAGELVAISSPDNFLSDYAAVAQYQGGFATFAEDSELTVRYNTPYDYTLSQVDASGNPLTQGAALLYYDFAEGLLTNYDYAGNAYDRIQDAGQLQSAIWALEGYTNPGPQYPNGTNQYYEFALANDPTALAPNDGRYDVDIMNLTDANSQPAQNLLVVPNATAPDSGVTGLMLGASVGILVLLRRQTRLSLAL